MKNTKTFLKGVDPVYWVIVLLVAVIAGAFWYGYVALNDQIIALQIQNVEQGEKLALLQGTLDDTTLSLEENIEATKMGLSSAIAEGEKHLQEKLGSVESQVGQVSGTVNTLEKLSKTDPELLQKYSKVFFLNEHYVPTRLVDIQNKNKYSESKDLEIHFEVKPHLEEMLADALKAGVEIYVASAHRSFDEQQVLKGQYTTTYGSGANQFSADQGYSEHQLGTTVDLITVGIGGTLDGFDDTSAYQWLLNNAYKYGFVLSYPKNNTYYIFEPWHWRFVGVGFATYLHSTGQDFYDLDQRKIDEYLVSIFD
jgi:LAS superfamily LD-carboxypeptidase LdcB